MQLREIISSVGRKRFILLIVLLVVNAAFSGFWQKYLLPLNAQLTAQKNDLEAARSSLVRDTQELPSKYAALKESEARFDALKEKGFIEEQDRIKARLKIDALRTESGLRGINYSIEPQKKLDHPSAYLLTTEDIISSGISVSMKGLTDLEMRDFIRRMHDEFSGLVTIESMEFDRDADVTNDNLIRLGKKEPVDFVTGKVKFKWYSLVPKDADPNSAQTEAFGGVSQ